MWHPPCPPGSTRRRRHPDPARDQPGAGSRRLTGPSRAGRPGRSVRGHRTDGCAHRRRCSQTPGGSGSQKRRDRHSGSATRGFHPGTGGLPFDHLARAGPATGPLGPSSSGPRAPLGWTPAGPVLRPRTVRPMTQSQPARVWMTARSTFGLAVKSKVRRALSRGNAAALMRRSERRRARSRRPR